MGMYFCLKWWIRKKLPINIINTKKAEGMHRKKEIYSVVITKDNKVVNVLEIAKDYIIVRFMNENMHSYLIYEFHTKDDQRVFLKGAYYREYQEEKEIELTIYNFHENGYVFMEKQNLLTNEFEEREGQFNVESNWDKYPEFGKYDHLLKIERE